jgi:ketosteroid isomerase-like protein
MADRRFSDAVAESDRANLELLKGNPQPIKQLYGHGDEITVLGGFGGFERGWAEVGPRLEWAASQFAGGSYERQTVSMVEGADLAYTVSIERNRVRENGKSGETQLDLRVTQIYRRENGHWRLVHRHADPLVTKRAP